MIFHFFCSIHIYPDLTRCCAGLCDLVASSRSDEVWIKLDVIPYPISSRLCRSALHNKGSFQLVSCKQQTNLLSSYSPFKKLNLLGYLYFIFQIYCFKADIFLDLNIHMGVACIDLVPFKEKIQVLSLSKLDLIVKVFHFL